MKSYRRPPWVLLLQMPALDTTLKEDHRVQQKRFELRGEPVLRSLTWVVHGPLLALLGVTLVGLLAWGLEVREASIAFKILFVCLMILLPLLFWAAGGFIISKLAHKHIQAQAQILRKQVILTLDTAAGTIQWNDCPPLPLAEVSGFRLISDRGLNYSGTTGSSSMMNLVIDTEAGPTTILPADLGNIKQKQQVLAQLEAALQNKNA